jgi:hypothetical protein
MTINFIIPGDISLPTGGYRYDREILQAWSNLDTPYNLISLEGDFPFPSEQDRAKAIRQIANMPDCDIAVVDGLAGGAMPEFMAQLSKQTSVIALIHHPLCLENGLSSEDQEILNAHEKEGLQFVKGIITTSIITAGTVSSLFGIPQEQIGTVLPGVDRGRPTKPRLSGQVNLLCIGSVIERKGHTYLIEALSSLTHYDWHLDCIGMLDETSKLFAKISKLIESHNLSSRITLHGAVSEETIDMAYQSADVFVLPSLYEGYGMAYAEAIVRGIPVIGTTAGAIPKTVPEDCGILVEPGRSDQLAAALEALISNSDKRIRYHRAALAREPEFPHWGRSAEQFLELIEDLT